MDFYSWIYEFQKGRDWHGLSKRFMALLLACVMTFTSVPFTAFAEDGVTGTQPVLEIVEPDAEPENVVTTEAEEQPEENEDILPPDGEEPDENADPENEDNRNVTTEEEEAEEDSLKSDSEITELDEEENDQPVPDSEAEEPEDGETEEDPDDADAVPGEDTENQEEPEDNEKTEEDADPEGEEPEEEEQAVPGDITTDAERLTLGLADWWFESPENLLACEDEHYADYTEVELDPMLGMPAGVSMQLKAENVLAGEYFTVRLPEEMYDVAFASAPAIAGAECELVPVEDPWGCTDLKVTFTEAGSYDEELKLQFTLTAGWGFVIDLQGLGEESCYWVLQPGTVAAAAVFLDEGEGTPVVNYIHAHISSIEFNEIVKKDEADPGYDWGPLLRPLEFDESSIRIRAYYNIVLDEGTVEESVELKLQDSVSADPLYLEFLHDGKGGTDGITIHHIPDSASGKKFTRYEIWVDTAALPAYSSGKPLELKIGENTSASTVELGKFTMTVANTQTLTVAPTVGAGDNAEFTFNAVFTNPDAKQSETDTNGKYFVEKQSIEQKLKVTSLATGEIRVPVGLNYTVSQEVNSDYRFGGYEKTIPPEEAGGEPDTVLSPDAPTGKIESGTDVSVTTVNYANNLSEEFTVTWYANGANRPTLTEHHFVLKYKVDGMEEAAPVADHLTDLGYESGKGPVFVKDEENPGHYAFTNLPSVDKDGNPITYTVERAATKWAEDVWQRYTVADEKNEDDTENFVIHEKASFTAYIRWLDGNNGPGKRAKSPSDLTLNLYRITDGGTYEWVPLPENCITYENGSPWVVSISDLPKYDAANQEYDYVLVQGTIDENDNVIDAPFSIYQTTYNNAVGTQGTDTHLCHNHGSIYNKIETEFDFTATKVWRDDTAADRAAQGAEVTLWRYAKNPSYNIKGIDDAMDKNLASPVVDRVFDHYTYDEDNKIIGSVYKDVVKTVTLDGSYDQQSINFDALHTYDPNGWEYVYFVRENSTGDNYALSYENDVAAGDTPITEGALIGKKVVNTKREKAKINVSVEWKCPSDLDNLNDSTSVALTIWAKTENGEYEELTIYDAQLGSFDVLIGDKKATATTVNGFNENITTLDLSFCANIYDANGQPYDMTTAQIREVKIINDGNEYTVKYPGDEGYGDSEDGKPYFTMGEDGDKYNVQSSLAGSNPNPPKGELKEYSYKLTNTITGTRQYELIKRWSKEFTAIELAEFASVGFDIVGTSTAAGSTSTTTYSGTVTNGLNQSVDKNGNTYWSTTVTLPKYDSEGYAYSYKATEAGVKNKDGDTVTGFNHYHTYTENSTTAYNYKNGSSSPYFRITKSWLDNGDMDAHGNVYFRIYRKADVRIALQEHADADLISLSALDAPYAEYSMNGVANNWYREITLADAESKIRAQEKTTPETTPETSLDPDAYLILEYSVDYGMEGMVGYKHSTQSAVYTCEALRTAAEENDTYSVSGSVQNSNRQYSTSAVYTKYSNAKSNLIGTAAFTNTRTGQATLTIEKIWKDPGTNRPEVKFQILRDGRAYNYVPPVVTPSDGSTDDQPTTQSDEQPETQKLTATIGETVRVSAAKLAEYLDSNGCITVVTPDGDSSDKITLELVDLPLFSEWGVQYSFNVAEQSLHDYTSEKGDITVAKDAATPDKLTYNYSYTNTRTGTTSHSAYKKWNDIATNGKDRPDLYFTLYQYLVAEAEAKGLDEQSTYEELKAKDVKLNIIKDKDPVLSIPTNQPSSGSEEGGTSAPIFRESDYDMKVTVNNLPAYNAIGQLYGYVLVETMSGSKDGVYENAFGTYVSKTERTVDDSGNVVEIFTNSLIGTTSLSGEKTWLGFVDKYLISKKDWPMPTILLYRSTEKVTLTEENYDELLASETIEQVNTLKSQDKYSFPYVQDMTAEDIAQELSAGKLVPVTDGDSKTYMLPKFAPDGSRYYYTVWERFDSSDSTTEEAARIAEQLYTKVSANGMLSNTFKNDVNRRKIEVTKSWDLRDYLKTLDAKYWKYPAVTFDLYRYTGETPDFNAEPYATIEIPASDFLENSNGEVTVAFDDLLIYSPDGKTQYNYCVKERTISSYTTEYSCDESVGVATPDYVTVTRTPENITDKNITDAVGVKNSYTREEQFNIKGTKYWNDYGNAFGIRPPKLELTVTRSAGSVSEAPITLVDAQNEADPNTHKYWLEWTNSAETKATDAYWYYTIHGLERYAPNGAQYTYYIKESVPDGYSTVNDTAVAYSYQAIDGDKTKTASQLTNKFDGKYEVRKNWVDGNNRYGLRPDNITVVLERSLDNGDWEKIPWSDQFSSPDKSLISVDNYVGAMLYGPDQQKPATHPDNTLANTKGNSWLITINNLPQTVKVGERIYSNVKYRCIEVKIGTENIGDDNKAGSYIYREEEVTHSAFRSVLKNLLDSTQLKVTKEWQDDDNQGAENAYYSRPASLEFKLQMCGYKEQTDENGQTVYDTDGQPILDYVSNNWIDVQVEGKDTFTLTAANDWKAELKDLPVAYYYTNEDGVSGTYYAVQFRAVEVTTTQKQENGENTDNDDPLLEGALNYIDNTSYLVEDQDHKRTSEGSLSTIKNGLIPHDVSKIEVTKIWYRQDKTGELTTTFELLHRIKDTGESWHHFYDPISKEWKQVTKVVSTKDCVNQEDGGESYTFYWENLPKYDREHNELEYTVIEHDLSGFCTDESYETRTETYEAGEGENKETKTRQVGSYTFKNIEEQTYTVQKTWVNTDYAHKDEAAFTSEFVLEQHIEGEKTGEADKWTEVVFPTAPVTPDSSDDTDSTDDPENQEPSAQNEDNGKDCEYMIPAVPAAPQTATVTLSTSKANDSYEEYLPKENPEDPASGEDEEGTEEPADSEPEEIVNPLSHTWTNLPKYTLDGKAITYRVRETKINNTHVDANNTNGDYIVSYLYDNAAAPAHGNTVTDATNRMVYGYVNLTKTAAYLAPEVTDGGVPMSGVTFDIYSGTGEDKTLYISGVKTDAYGHLICNDDGTYDNLSRNEDGTYGDAVDAKYLITGTYTLVETGTHADYSIWASEITFTVGVNGGQDDTGEHGTAWISATEQTPADSAEAAAHGLTLTTDYLHPDSAHSASCICKPLTGAAKAYNLESRGVLSFTKTDGTRNETTGNPIDPHKDAGQTESKAWFGVYLNYDSESGKCSGLVAYMTGGDSAEMTLTTIGPNAETIDPAAQTNKVGIPYLREDTDTNKGLTLLSGTYYVQELVPPAGYILDTRVREAFVPKLDANDNTPYSENEGYFTPDSETNLEKNEWANNPNRIKLYKRDQYGRKVDLNGKYLVLSTQGKFLTGDSEIHLYQVFKDGDVPCKDAQDKPFAPGKMPNIQYDAEEECWIISGLLDSGKSYTISEPDVNVPNNYLQASDFTFKMENDGSITDSSDPEKKNNKENPLAATGNDYVNYYHSDDPEKTEDCNQVVLRDTSRYLDNVILKKVLEKVDSKENQPIEDIAFGLERNTSADPDVENWESVLEPGIYLVTDADGKIDLQDLQYYVKHSVDEDGQDIYTKVEITETDFVKNVFTDCDLKYGLDVGTYRFVEIEYGASDTYFLAAPAQFEIKAYGKVTENRENCTTVDFMTAEKANGNPNLTQTESRTGTLKNVPVERTKLLDLTKVDNSNPEAVRNLYGARFTLVYTSINHDQSSAQTDKDTLTITQNCKTDTDGKLYLADENWEFVENSEDHKVAPDISNKGDYVLTEIQAPEHYMTRTKNGTADQTVLLTFSVTSENKVVEISSVTGSSDLIVEQPKQVAGENSISLTLTVNNEKTVVSVSKFNDILSTLTKSKDQKNVNGEPLIGAKLAIYQGDTQVWKNFDAENDQTNQSEWQLPDGTLIENTVYELQEIEAPVGYLEAEPIYFKIFGTYETEVTKEDGTKETVWKSVIYVQSGTDSEGNPAWSPAQNIRDHKLAMVDEAIIAAVDLLKVVGTAENNEPLPGAKFDVYSLDGTGTKLGTAVTNAAGHLVWDTIDVYGLIYNADGKRITASDVKPTTIILQQNANGYRFTEIYAPDHAYNNGGSYEVTITDGNYTDYKTDDGYNTSKFVDIIAADSDPAVEEQPGTADLGTEYIPLVNPPYKSTVTLTKYDHDKEALKDLIPGTQFTLYRKNVSGNWVQATADDAIAAPESKTEPISAGVFATGEDGKLEIEIHKKGEYKLTETKPTSGYSGSAEFTFELKDGPKGSAYGHEGTAELKDASDATGVPNERLMGSVKLKKTDSEASSADMNGVQFILTRTSNPAAAADSVPEAERLTDWAMKNIAIVEVGKSYEVVQENGNWKLNVSDGISGEINISGLNWATYTLKEHREKNGYVFLNPETYYFEVDSTHLEPQVTTDNTVPNTKNRFSLVKKSTEADNTTILQGAQFKLYPVTEADNVLTMGTTVQEFYSAPNLVTPDAEVIITGSTMIYGLPKGMYVLREEKAPDGYELAKDVFFEMGQDGKISGVTTCTVDEDRFVRTDSTSAITELDNNTKDQSGILAPTLTVKDKPIEVNLKKALSDAESGASLTGRGDAEYTIKGIFAGETTEETKEFTGNEIESDLKAILVGGRDYVLTETKAPDGYEVRNAVTISVAKDGKVTLKAGETATYLACDNENPDGIARLTLTDEPIEMALAKNGLVDKKTITGLTGAEFTISGKMVTVTDGVASVSKTNIQHVTVDSACEDTHGRLIGGEIYTITETKAPNGYKVTPEFTVKLDIYGNIESISATEHSGKNTETLTVTNEPNVIQFLKVEDNNKPLAGAKFSLKAKVADPAGSPAFVNVGENEPGTITTGAANDDYLSKSATEITWTSTTSPTVIQNMLIADVVYELTELDGENRVPNHEVMRTPIYFHMTKEGKVVIEENGNSIIPNNDGLDAAKVSDDIKMTIQNPIIKGSVTLTKYWENETGDTLDTSRILPGATYKLTRIVNEHGTAVNEQIKTNAKADGSYAYNLSGTETTFVTDNTGKININGLPEGTYEFQEIAAPMAYHVNTAPVEFEIHDKDDAHVTNAQDVDTRINATIELSKFTNDVSHVLSGANFLVEYWEPTASEYRKIGYLTEQTDTDGKDTGVYTMSLGEFKSGADPEGLWRGYYRLTELSAPGQMLNPNDLITRNTIEFEIGNEIKFIYDVKTGTKFHETDENEIVYTPGGKFISITDAGVIDTPIPTKDIEVEKLWPNDTDLRNTFRPTSISVQLYRSYTDKNGKTQKEKVGDPETISAGTDGKWKYTWKDKPAYFNDDSAGEKHVTRLYTYTVEEVTDESYNFWTWYKDDYSHDYPEDGRTSEYEKYAGGEDGDVTAKITNTLDLVPLTIRKTLGGGSTTDAFQVRVILKYNATTFAGNNANGYFMDAYSLVGSETKRQPDADGWVTIYGNERLTINLPKGIVYEVQEHPVSEGSKLAYEENSDLDYVIRYLSGYSGTLNAATTAEIRNAVVKHLSLTKVDGTTKLKDAKFTVSYEPLDATKYKAPIYVDDAYELEDCVTDSDGVLYDKNGKLIDLTNQGTYTITETQAPDGYMTPTKNDGKQIPVAVVTVSNQDIMTVAKGSDNAAALVTLNGNNGVTADGSTAELTVANQKTVAKIGKTIDYAKATGKDSQEGAYLPDAKLEIQQLVDGAWTTVANSTDSGESWTTENKAYVTEAGVLSENVQYRLVETKTVVGYKQAADVYFKLDGTYVEEDGTRYSRIVITDENGIVITDENGNKLAQNADGAAYGAPGVIGCQLNMVDETIIAPVDLQKVLKSGEDTDAKWNALKDVEFTVKKGDTTLGVAVTNENGYLVWKSISGYGSNLIYDADGHILTAGGKDTRIILREVSGGYTLTETYAPDHVYNDSRIYPVTVKVGHYDDYRTGATSGLYNSNKYINAVSPDDTLSVRGTTTEYTDETKITTLAENLPYRSTVKLHKYDDNGEAVVEENGNTTIHAVAGAEFTLFRVTDDVKVAYGKAWYSADATSVREDGKFSTDDNGNLSITIPEKGTYVLEETTPAKGYDEKAETFADASFTFVLKDKQEDGAFGYDNTNELKPDGNQTGVPNTRLMGSVTLTKQDQDDKNADMNGVIFTLTRKSTYLENAEVHGLPLNASFDVEVGKRYVVQQVEQQDGTKKWEPVEQTGEDSGAEPNKLIITGLNWGTYELQEKTELSGYVHSEEVYEFTIEPEHLDPVFKDKTSNTVLNQKNDVVFYKTNVIDSTVGVSEIKPLEGAKFQVHVGAAGQACTENCELVMFYLDPQYTDPKVLGDKDVTKKTDTAISGRDGKVHIYGLPTAPESDQPTQYHLVEIEAPKGYTIQTVPVDFTIDRAGNVVWQDSSTNTPVNDKPVTMIDQPIKISIEKIGESVEDTLDDTEFELTDICTGECDHKWADGTTDKVELTTGSDGRKMIPIEKVIAGHTYQLEETQAHDGYKRNAVVKFTVKPDGTVALRDLIGGYTGTDKNDDTKQISTAQLIDPGTTIQISNEKIRLSLVKLDYDDFVLAGEDENPVEKVQKLKDVEFTLAPAAGYAFAALEATDGYTTSPQTFKTKENGTIDFPAGLLKCGNSYVLTEKENPDHSYRFSEESITITVSDAGEISISTHDFFKSSTKIVDPHEIPNILALNQKIHLDIVKVDEVSKDPLSGVVLELQKKNDETGEFEPVVISGVSQATDTLLNGQWKTDDTGKVTFVATTVNNENYPFTDGTYCLTEISTPVGHNKLTKPLVFEIDRTGKVTTMQDGTDLTAGFFSAFNPTDGKPGEITLTVRNPAYTDLEIHKENPTRTPLKDVEFRLEYRNGSVYNNVKLISDENGTRIDVGDNHIPTVGTADEAKLSTNESGILTFGYLPDGTYKLTELRTAPGYNLLSQPLIIEINRNTGTYQWKSGESGEWSALNNPVQNVLSMTVINKQGFVFPATGVATPQLPKAILGITAFLEGLVLFLYQRRTKRRRRGAEV